MEHAVREFGRDDFDEGVWEWLASATRYLSCDFADEEGEDRLAALLTELDEERGTRGNRVYYLAIPPQAMPRSSRPSASAAATDGLDASDHREAVRSRPRLGAEPHRADQPLLHRGRGLPHRPLPRQGDRPEHAGAAVRERDLRADLEPPVHRPRADHGRRDARDRGPGRLLRAGGRDPRHLPEPHAPARRADGDGAADRLHRRLGAQREGEGAEGDPHARPEAHRARPVRARLRRRQGGAPATGRRRASPPTR